MKRYLIHIALCCTCVAFAQSTEIRTLQEALSLAEKNSYTVLLSAAHKDLAYTTVRSAYGNALNPRVPVSASITDNAKLPVNFIPAEAFGGPPGTYRQITLGQQYITGLNIAPQFDIINIGALAKIKSARINRQLTESNSLITKKGLYDQINACYHNILSFQAQIELLKANELKADSILKVVHDKYGQGLVRKQDLNDAEINKILVVDKIEQSTLSLEQQYLTLSVLLDSQGTLRISQDLWTLSIDSGAVKAYGDLSVSNSEIQKAFASAEYGASKWQNMPTLSFVSSFNWQNNSNTQFFDSRQPYINSNYWSLRFSWDFPTNISKLSSLKTSQINYRIAQINAAHAALQNKMQNEQSNKDYAKAWLQYNNFEKVYKLKLDNFQKSKNQYEANILSLDRLLLAHNDLISSEINRATSLANISFIHSKIEINNQIK